MIFGRNTFLALLFMCEGSPAYLSMPSSAQKHSLLQLGNRYSRQYSLFISPFTYCFLVLSVSSLGFCDKAITDTLARVKVIMMLMQFNIATK